MLIRGEQRPGIGVGHRPPIRSARERRDDLPRTGRLVLRCGRVTDEDRAAARCVLRHLPVVRPHDLDASHRGGIGIQREREARNGRWRRTSVDRQRLLQRLDERDPHQPGARLHRQPELQRLAFAQVEQPHALAIQPDLQLVRPAGPSAQRDLDDVLGVEREVMTHRKAATRPEREVFADPVVLRQQWGCLVDDGGRAQRRIAHRAATDLRGRQEIPLQQSGRDRQNIADVVEAVARLVRREQRPAIDLERQQIADGVCVFGAVEAMDCRSARIGIRRRGAVERGLEIRDGRGVGRGVRAPSRRRRHHAGPELAYHLFPHFGIVAHPIGVDRLERESSRTESFAVTRHAVAIEHSTRSKGRRRAGGLLCVERCCARGERESGLRTRGTRAMHGPYRQRHANHHAHEDRWRFRLRGQRATSFASLRARHLASLGSAGLV